MAAKNMQDTRVLKGNAFHQAVAGQPFHDESRIYKNSDSGIMYVLPGHPIKMSMYLLRTHM